MRDMFHGYYQLTDEALAAIWKKCLFSFDTSVLLGLYIYSEKTRNDYLACSLLLALEGQALPLSSKYSQTDQAILIQHRRSSVIRLCRPLIPLGVGERKRLRFDPGPADGQNLSTR